MIEQKCLKNWRLLSSSKIRNVREYKLAFFFPFFPNVGHYVCLPNDQKKKKEREILSTIALSRKLNALMRNKCIGRHRSVLKMTDFKSLRLCRRKFSIWRSVRSATRNSDIEMGMTATSLPFCLPKDSFYSPVYLVISREKMR